MLGSHTYLGCTFINSLLWPLIRNPDPTTWSQASIYLKDPLNPRASTANDVFLSIVSPGFSLYQTSGSLHELFMPSRSGKLFYINKFSYQHVVQPWHCLHHSVCILILWKHFPEDFTLMMLLSNFSSALSQRQMSKENRGFTLLLLTSC